MSPEIPFIRAQDVEHKLSWPVLCDAIEAAHRSTIAEIGDTLLSRGADKMLSRAAWIDGLGLGVKTASVFPGNAAEGRPTVQGAMLVFDDVTGAPRAVIENALITRWKTAADSVLGARFLARQDASRLLIIGAGAVAQSLIEAYPAVLPAVNDIVVWNRSVERAERLASETGARVAQDLQAAVAEADIIATATLSQSPVLQGAWLHPGQHVDLIGAFTPQMREADDVVLQRGRLFVDARATTLDHIGELLIPLREKRIFPEDIEGDFYDLAQGHVGRKSIDEITVFKNGGGAHLDLMTANIILNAL